MCDEDSQLSPELKYDVDSLNMQETKTPIGRETDRCETHGSPREFTGEPDSESSNCSEFAYRSTVGNNVDAIECQTINVLADKPN